MKVKAFIFTIILFPFLFESGLAQTKQEVVRWLNTDGEEYLKDITGNSSIFWEVENNGTLKVTNHKASHVGTKKVIRKYTYLNLYELSSREPLITGDGESKGFILKCKSEAENCLKTRYYYTNTNFEAEASSSLLFSLEENFDEEKGKELEKKLLLIIQLISGKDMD